MCMILRRQSKHLFVLEDSSSFQRMFLILKKTIQKSLRLKVTSKGDIFYRDAPIEKLGDHYKVVFAK